MAFSFFMKRRPAQKPVSYISLPKNTQTAVAEPPIRRSTIVTTPPAEANAKQHTAKSVYAFIDASNLFWGGREGMGFKISYSKLLQILRQRFGVTKAFYYGGIRIYDFEYSILDNKPLDLTKLHEHLTELQKTAEPAEAELIGKSLNKLNFYQLLESYGYIMKIKPAKVFYDEDDENQERPILKANCDVDMTFDMMRYMSQYAGVVAMTGDGDFASVLSYLKAQDRSITVISRWDRTAKEIRQIAGDNFVDFGRLHHMVQYRDRS